MEIFSRPSSHLKWHPPPHFCFASGNSKKMQSVRSGNLPSERHQVTEDTSMSHDTSWFNPGSYHVRRPSMSIHQRGASLISGPLAGHKPIYSNNQSSEGASTVARTRHSPPTYIPSLKIEPVAADVKWRHCRAAIDRHRPLPGPVGTPECRRGQRKMIERLSAAVPWFPFLRIRSK